MQSTNAQRRDEDLLRVLQRKNEEPMTMILTEPCKCGNAARYITAKGEGVCAICPLVDKVDALPLRNVGALLQWARKVQKSPVVNGRRLAELNNIIQRKPKVPR